MSDDAAPDPTPATAERYAPGQRRAYESSAYPWNLMRVPRMLDVSGQRVRHPTLTSGVFVVHGIGEQEWMSTSAALRSGFEDAVLAVRDWQQAHPDQAGQAADPLAIPAPFIMDGFWSNYTDLESTFPDEWGHFQPHEKDFFGTLWRQRTLSIPRVFHWFLQQQLRLLHPRVLREVGLVRWLLYLPLQLIAPAALALATLRYPKLFIGFLSDVRLYLDPRGVIERAIVQRIDYRVGAQFLQMLGLDWNFLPLREAERLRAGHQVLAFERVVWVAHSLGTVISFNVISDLLHRANAILATKVTPDLSPAERIEIETQQEGARRFRVGLEHFITLGSPLEKTAFLFGDALRRWPPSHSVEAENFDWVNFHHMLDPVSGRLRHERLVEHRRPVNYHLRSGWIPGLAHVAYWTDTATLRFILSRTYGRRVLPDGEYKPFGRLALVARALLAYAIWGALLTAAAAFVALKLWRAWQAGSPVLWDLLELSFFG